jgi:hypothetical protein
MWVMLVSLLAVRDIDVFLEPLQSGHELAADAEGA